MAQTLWRLPRQACLITLPLVRGRVKLRGRPPGQALTLEERLRRMTGPPPQAVNIGFHHRPERSRRQLTQVVRQNQADRALEQAARAQTLRVPLDEVEAECRRSDGPEHALAVAQHYGVFRDMFGDGVFFTPVQPVRVEYADAEDDDVCSVVHTGNVIKPAEARLQPAVSFEAAENSLWTLVCTNLEGCLGGDAPETVHWLVTDIPAGDVTAGRHLYPYLQPLPFRGTGYHRMAFVLFRQDGVLPESDVQSPESCVGPAQRGFSTQQFYGRHQDQLTPAGLAFFQTDWDSSVTKFFHSQLQRKEPIFEFEWKPTYIKRQRWFPKGESVSHYLDRYADPRDLHKQMLLKHLATVHPFEGLKEGPKYPLAIKKDPDNRPPTWIINEQRKEARKISKYYYIERRPETVFDPHV